MFLLQSLIRAFVDVPHEIIKAFGRFVEHFPQAHHVEPGDLLVAQLVPALAPDGLPESGLRVGAQRGRRQLSPIPDALERVVSCLGGRSQFVLRFGIHQQHLGVSNQPPYHWTFG